MGEKILSSISAKLRLYASLTRKEIYMSAGTNSIKNMSVNNVTKDDCLTLPAHPVGLGACESLLQARDFLCCLSQAQYTEICKPYAQSCIGGHIRHVLDLFLAIKLGFENGDLVDFDFRRRGHAIESSISVALSEIDDHIDWLCSVFTSADIDALLERSVHVKTEVCFEQTKWSQLQSSFGRELVFVASHAVHHFALAGMIAKIQKVPLSQSFGIAPATRTFLRVDTPA